MKTRDTKPYTLILRTEATKVEFKESAVRSNIAGKKLPPAHAVNMFSHMINVRCQLIGNRFVNDQVATFLDLLNIIFG